jgi:glycosyltransferase involved in cell wall biosynthesis
MRVALVADTFSVTEGTGIARYAGELRTGLTSLGVIVEPIAPQPPRLPLGQALNHAFRMPYLVAKKAQHSDVVHAASPITALAFPLLRKPKVVTYHDLVALHGRAVGTAVHTRLSAPLFLRIGRFADRIIANSSATRDEIVERLGAPEHEISVVSWGVSQIFRPRHRVARQSRVVGYVGTLNRRKGLPYLIKSFHMLRMRYPATDARLILCGARNGEYARLMRLTAELGLSQFVEFRGSVSDDDLVEAYNSFDVFVLPSEWEGFGLPILEAQRCGVPVIVRQGAHIPEEVSACCLKAASEEDMADKIYALLTDAESRQDLAGRGLEYSQQFTWERAVQQTVSVYQELLSTG